VDLLQRPEERSVEWERATSVLATQVGAAEPLGDAGSGHSIVENDVVGLIVGAPAPSDAGWFQPCKRTATTWWAAKKAQVRALSPGRAFLYPRCHPYGSPDSEQPVVSVGL
jgi:hypothetical protein